jgi:hypothetical protein
MPKHVGVENLERINKTPTTSLSICWSFCNLIDLFRPRLIVSSKVFQVVFVHFVYNSAVFLTFCSCSFLLYVVRLLFFSANWRSRFFETSVNSQNITGLFSFWELNEIRWNVAGVGVGRGARCAAASSIRVHGTGKGRKINTLNKKYYFLRSTVYSYYRDNRKFNNTRVIFSKVLNFY